VKHFLVASVLVAAAAAAGLAFMDRPYRLEAVGQPGDQQALDHRDSAYSSITWVVSEGEDYAQLRFFDRVEGGTCLHPSWAELINLAKTQPALAHLVPSESDLAATRHSAGRPDVMWPNTWTPDPGTVSNSAYIRLFPVGVLLNQSLIDAAKGDVRVAAPRILVVGLGSGIGLATLAHHFPNAAITVVDIDATVIAMVRDHYPLLRWLETQKRADGEPRLRFVARDARQFIRFDAAREPKRDLVVLDAYTSGSTIPPHLMTREFFAEIGNVLTDGGLFMANIIGNVTSVDGKSGDKSLVLGGAIRSLRAAGLVNAWNIPVLSGGDNAGSIDANRQRNNIVLASRAPLDPRRNAAGWERLQHFELLPELPLATYTSSVYLLADDKQNRFISATLPAAGVDEVDPGLRGSLTTRRADADSVSNPVLSFSQDRSVVERTLRAARTWAERTKQPLPLGWTDLGDATYIQRRDTDWVLAGRETFRASVIAARDGTKWSGEALTGDVEQGERPRIKDATWLIPDAPLFTDQRPNADIYNH
jgi:hypothetical protein